MCGPLKYPASLHLRWCSNYYDTGRYVYASEKRARQTVIIKTSVGSDSRSNFHSPTGSAWAWPRSKSQFLKTSKTYLNCRRGLRDKRSFRMLFAVYRSRAINRKSQKDQGFPYLRRRPREHSAIFTTDRELCPFLFLHISSLYLENGPAPRGMRGLRIFELERNLHFFLLK